MTDYVATFWTHLAAMRTLRSLLEAGIDAAAEPVPRCLSASCGACVRYRAQTPMEALMHRDYERVYAVTADHRYEAVLGNDAPV